ncbi:MAG: DUF3488 and transglutaminase-like domain-containing protein [Microbacterium sp.]
MTLTETPRRAPQVPPPASADPPPQRTPRRRQRIGALTAWTGIAIVASLMPLSRMLTPGWMLTALVVITLVMLAGFFVRRTRLPGVATLVELVVWAVCVTFLLPPEVPRTARLLPTTHTLSGVWSVLSSASVELATGVAPVEPHAALTWALIGAVSLFTIVISFIALTVRLPLLAAAGLIPVALIPALIVPQQIEPAYFLPLALALLMMLWAQTRSRASRLGAAGGAVGVGFATAAITIVALVAGLAVPSVLPAPDARSVFGLGRTATINASLNMGEDLRQTMSTEVLRLTTTATSAPYLRVATLTSFTGTTWRPDTGSMTDVSLGLDAPTDPAQGIATTPGSGTVRITGLSGQMAPVPYAITGIDAPNSSWKMLNVNRTVNTGSTSVLGESYDLEWFTADPTLEQAEAAPAGAGTTLTSALELPRNLPSIISETARIATMGQNTPYDKLAAMQSWFREGDFQYSLDAPVAGDFDGSGMDAIAAFLALKKGYCVHFASAFAVMARTLGIPTRIVVGYLPGERISRDEEDLLEYSYDSSQLHAWPEAYLTGIGWVPFDPTVSLGEPTRFSSDVGDPDATDDTPTEPTPRATASTPQRDPGRPDETTADGGGAASESHVDVRAIVTGVLIVLAVLLVLAAPAIVRRARRSRRLHAPPGVLPRAVWRELVDSVIDAGLDVGAHESPRALGTRLVQYKRVHKADMDLLVDGVERSAYGRSAAAASADDLVAALHRARRTLLPERRDRIRTAILPRSLTRRPTLRPAASDD